MGGLHSRLLLCFEGVVGKKRFALFDTSGSVD